MEERRALLADPAMRTLQGVFAAVPDPRDRRGRRYDLPFLLTCLVAALLCDCNRLGAVGQWCAERSWSGGIPLHASSRRPVPCYAGFCRA